MQYDAEIIQTRSLSRRFGDTTAVDALTLDIYRGEVFGFLGHNGAGKTTTVRLLNGILGPTAGSCRVLGLDPVSEGSALRRQTGVLTESPSLEERLTAREILFLYGRMYGVDPDRLVARVTVLLGEFGLEDRADEVAGSYSKGMRQRLALARTLIHNPSVLFLDEPTAGLDPVGQRDVHELVVQLSQESGRTIFLCTHDLVEAQKLCHRVAVMQRGQLVALGTPEGLAQELQQGVHLEITTDACPPNDALVGLPVITDSSDRLSAFSWDESTHTAGVWLSTREAIPSLVAALVTAGIHIYRVTPVEPTLEDVYFAINDRSTGDHAKHPTP